MKVSILLCAIGLTSLPGPVAGAHDKDAPLDTAQKPFLAQDESVRRALTADNLSAAQQAAAAMIAESKNGLVPPATAEKTAQRAALIETVNRLAQDGSLKTARNAFKQPSQRAIHLAGGQPGYHVAHCPMVEHNEGNWVQTTRKISNPHLGAAMPTCGSIKS